MADISNEATVEAVELLQQLGVTEYEAKCFVALTRLPHGTARDVSAIADVPQTRVYDAVRALEAEGLVEIQHASPKQFRALSVEEAIETLERQYDSRLDALQSALDDVEPEDDPDTPTTQEVWSLTGSEAIAARTEQLVEEAEAEVLIVGAERPFTETLYDRLRAATDRGVDVVVGTLSRDEGAEVRDRLPGTEVFESDLDWLDAPAGETVSIGVLAMADRSVLLVSARTDHGPDEETSETAVFGRGFTNGLVIIARRLFERGL